MSRKISFITYNLQGPSRNGKALGDLPQTQVYELPICSLSYAPLRLARLWIMVLAEEISNRSQSKSTKETRELAYPCIL